MLLAVTAVAVIAGAVRLLGGLGGSLVAVGTMIAAAAWKRRLGELFTTADGVIWMGGVVLWLAAFVRFTYGPWGVELTFAGFAEYAGPSWDGIGTMVVITAPASLGVVLAATALFGALYGGTPTLQRMRVRTIGAAIVAISAIHIVLYARSSIAYGTSWGIPELLAAGSLTAVAAVGASTICCRSWNLRLAIVHLTVAFWVLTQYVPVFWPNPQMAPLSDYGPALWMILLASLSILAASAKTMAVAVAEPRS